MLWNGSGKPIQHVISFWLWAKEEGWQILKALLQWFLCYHLPRSFKILMNLFAFLYVKANAKKLCQYPLFQQTADVSIFVEI